ncbi:zf-HC2 domain-containing protein [Saccharomonospora iraqiensis]|uniref:zf-HC2 domain-containing protein n=1 Tax=Saccharomonospora iraqiensis TaxID=52698 RepID=UPI00022E2040|nr:zf-HC2 domain-containing protein [Saccharomonospora iraqiensis]
MTSNRGWGFSESHLLPDVVVAFVDQELSPGAQERAAAHLAHCPGCAAEVAAQRAASSAVRKAESPSIPAGFLANLRAIPQHTDTPSVPDNLAVDPDGQIVTVQRPGQVAGLRGGALGTSSPLGTASTVLGGGGLRFWSVRRRATQGAGVVVSGLVLSALAFTATSGVGASGGTGDAESPGPGSSGVWPAHLGSPRGASPTADTGGTTSPAPGTPVATTVSGPPTGSASAPRGSATGTSTSGTGTGTASATGTATAVSERTEPTVPSTGLPGTPALTGPGYGPR